MALSQGTVSKPFLLDGLSFNVKSNDDQGRDLTINRTPQIPYTSSERSSGNQFFNNDGSISWADYNLNTNAVFQKGAPDIFVDNLLNNPSYLNAIKNNSDYWSQNNFIPFNEAVDLNIGTGALNQQQNQNTSKGGSKNSGASLWYPLTRDSNLDYLKVTVLEYVVPGLPGSGTFVTDSTESSRRKKSTGTTVFLPMQPGIKDSNGVDWNEDRLNFLQAKGAKAAINAINNIGNGDFAAAIKGLGFDVGEAAKDLMGSAGIGEYLTSYFAGQAVGANVIGRTAGAVLNNNLELLFQGPRLRTFNYNYKFTPREAREAQMVRDIIRLFKTESAVRRSDTGLFLVTPNVFDLEYIHGPTGVQHPFLNEIKTCALTNISVDYTPDGSYMTYQDGSMTSYSVTLSFSELEPIYRDDQESSGGTGY